MMKEDRVANPKKFDTKDKSSGTKMIKNNSASEKNQINEYFTGSIPFLK